MTTPVTVNNVAPSTVAINVSAATINENGSTTLSGSFVDPGTLDTHVVTINWGDGSAPQTVNLAAGVLTFSGVTHQYLQDGNDSVSVTVADDHATTAAVTTPVTVNNVAPSSVAINVSAATLNENGSTTLSGSFVDPGTLDTHVVTINWGDGSAPQTVNLAAGVLTFSGVAHQYLQDGNDSISVTVADDHATTAAVTTPVTVNNVAPSTVAINVSAATLNENGSTTLSGSFVDPGTLDSHVVTINWGDGSAPQTVNLAAGVLTFSGVAHQYLQDGNDSVSVTVADDHATTAAVTTPVAVNNVAPSTVTINVSAATINENGSTTLSGSFVDPGTLDSHVVTINWGDGSAPQTVNLAAGVLTFSGVAHQYLQDGNDSVSVTVADDHATTAAVTTPVAVNNVAPSTVAINVSAATINENGSTTLSGSFVDPGTLDSHVVTINWGDGSVPQTVNLAAGVLTFSGVTHQYLQDGNDAVSVTVADDHATTAAVTTPVTVNNVAPSSVAINVSAATLNENGSTTLSGSFVDPGTLDTHVVTINWGDGSAPQTVNLAAGVLTFSGVAHQYLQDGNDAVSVTVADDHTTTAAVTTPVTVNNVAPSTVAINLSAPTINENGSTMLSGSFTDPGSLDTHVLTINWGDGSAPQTVNLAAGVLTFSGVAHQYLQDGNDSISVTVADDHATTAAVATPVTVNNVAPSNVSISLTAPTINENGSTTLNGSFTDPGTLDTHVVTINWGDGSPAQTVNLTAGTTTFSVPHQYLQDGNYPISVTVADNGGGISASVSTPATVNNVAPSNVAVSLTAATINENGTTTLNGSFTDPGTLDTHVVTINWGDGTPAQTINLTAGVTTFSVPHQYLQDGNYPISVTVADNGGGTSASVSTPATVNNVATSNVAVSLTASTINENGSTTLNGSFTDPGTLDTHIVTINWGDGNTQTINLAAGVTTFSTPHQYLQDGSYPISVTVADNSGATSTSVSTPATVNNVAPSNVAVSLTASSISQNGTTTLNGSFTDPGTLDVHVVTINWGDDNTQTVNLAAGVTIFSVPHQYLQDGNYSINVSVADDGGSSSSAVSTPITVNNTPPSNVAISLTAPTINENGTTTLNGSFIDPDTADTHVVTINWGDGSTQTVNLTAGVTTFSAPHQYLQNGNYPISVGVADSSGGSSASISTPATVNNVAPSNVAVSLTASTINENGSTTLNGSFTDPGTLDTHVVTINWGDGSTAQTVNLAAGVTTFSAPHQYLQDGNYPISVTVADNGGGSSASVSTPATVNNVAPSNVTVSLTAPTINENGSTTLNGSFIDPGTLDTHIVTINWGDGRRSADGQPRCRRYRLQHPASVPARWQLSDRRQRRRQWWRCLREREHARYGEQCRAVECCRQPDRRHHQRERLDDSQRQLHRSRYPRHPRRHHQLGRRRRSANRQPGGRRHQLQHATPVPARW